MNPKHPIYIVSKNRADSRMTSRTLEELHVPYYIVVEEQEYETYCAVIDRSKVLILDKRFQTDYDTCDALGSTKSKGPGAARNFAWDHAIKSGATWHWVMDDNIRHFFRLNQNMRVRVTDGSIFRAMEDFCERYINLAMAGPNYRFFVPSRSKRPPYVTNTRIYSCNLIRNDTPFRWRGRYNEDTDLSLRMLKAGWCTVQFNAFLQGKVATQTVKGGNTAEFYAKEGTLAKSMMQVQLHPDVSRLVKKYGRWHHFVDYTPFKKMKLVRKQGVLPPRASVNNYGMKLKRLKPSDKVKS